jgi:predicted nucleic acid-binding protein
VKAYLDSSVIIRVIRQEPRVLPEWDEIDEGVTCSIARVECYRALFRHRMDGTLDQEGFAGGIAKLEAILGRIRIVPFDAVIDRACRPFPGPVRALDAIHLATALSVRDSQPENESPIVFATHDKTLGLAARKMGLAVVGV